ncbi:Thioesterase superfamily [Senna tora]|uniref:Thioesterase superfamily n=1 Tax=Senna tora TaxID=362788 RepID=A0A834XD22_9FABA|nr:Thioesterase superfamily [Senna tora]
MEEQHSNQIWVMHKKSMEESIIGERIEKHLRNLCNGSKGYAIEALIANHVRPINIHTGFMLCEFVVHHGVSDENGNWHVGAMATLIDVIGSLTVFSFTASDNVTVDFALSYFSNAKLQEEVEIEGKVMGKKERMTSDENGNWHVGAMATLIDIIGGLTAFSFTAYENVTVDFAVSYFSNAKLYEEVEIEGKVVGKKERMTSVSVKVRKKHNGELVALAKLWMAAANSKITRVFTSKI